MRVTKLRFAVAAIVVMIAAEIPPIRAWLTTPLVVATADSTGDAAYILAGGSAFYERMAAAADLVLMHRVPRLYLMRENGKAAFSFTASRNWTPTEWAVEYLKWRGVPEEAIQIFDDKKLSKLGTLDEAMSLAAVLPASVNRLVLVTSPAHTRRSVMAFTRNLPKRVAILSYPAVEIRQSTEFYHPLTVEYFKLLVYAIVA